MNNLSLEQLDITGDELTIVRAILAQHLPDCSVWAFGSRVTGKAGPYSDLDLVILDKAPLSFALMADLVEAFDQSDLPFKVDIVDWAKTNETFKKIIHQRKIVLRAAGSAD